MRFSKNPGLLSLFALAMLLTVGCSNEKKTDKKDGGDQSSVTAPDQPEKEFRGESNACQEFAGEI